MPAVDLRTVPKASRLEQNNRRSRLANYLWPSLTALYVLLIAITAQRPLWFDEILTYLIAKTPSVPAMLRLVMAWDLNPPLLHFLSHISLLLDPQRPRLVRLPSILAFYGASYFLFRYMREKLNVAYAALAITIFWFSPLFAYAIEARPYALLCFWFAAVLLAWDRATAPPRMRWHLIAVWLSAAGLLFSHVFGAVSLVPFYVAELVRFRNRRKPDWPLWLALGTPLLITVTYLPLFAGFSTVSQYPPAFQASPRKIASFYWNAMLTPALLAGFTTLAAWFRLPGKRDASVHRPLSWEIALWVMLALMAVALGLLLMMSAAPFWGRYAITSGLALCVILAYVSYRLLRGSLQAGYFAVALGSVCLIALDAIKPAYWSLVRPLPKNAAALTTLDPDLPLVIASGLTFLEMTQRETPALVNRLYLLQDKAAAIHYANATIFEDFEPFQRAFGFGGKVESYGSFINQHPHFLVVGTFAYPEDWLLRKLAAEGASIKERGNWNWPYKDKSVFEVRVTRSEARSPQ